MILLLLATFAHADGLVRDIIGINEGVAIPERVLDLVPANEIKEEFDRDIALIKTLGVRHVRVHSGRYPYSNWHDQSTSGRSDIAILDQYLQKLFQAGLQPHLMISPWPGNHTADFTKSYVPEDLLGYLNWVTQIVERYDGDGVDDLPELGGKINVWEIDNEPDIHYAGSLRNADTPFEPPSEYASIAKLTADAVHTADATATVVHGGIFNPGRAEGADYLRALWADPHFARVIDGVNLHRYPDRSGIEDIWRAVALGREVAPHKPVWLTEVSTSSLRRGNPDEYAQAVDLLNLILGGLNQGIARIYWHSLVESPNYYNTNRRAPLTRGRHLFVGEPGKTVAWHGLHRWRDPQPKLAAIALTNFLALFGNVTQESLKSIPIENADALQFGDDLLLFGSAKTVQIQAANGGTVRQLIPDKKGSFFTSKLLPNAKGKIEILLDAGPVAVRLGKEKEDIPE
jgi:hypothetical protein